MTDHTISLPDVSAMAVPEAKQALRATVRAARAKRTPAAREEAEACWVTTVLDFLGTATTVAGYISVNNEPGTRALCDAIVASGRTLLVPKLGPGLTRQWARYTGADNLTDQAPGRPPAPRGEALDSTVLREVDAAFIPALLVNHDGVRLGQGGGWYDRLLKQLDSATPVGALIWPEEYVHTPLPHDEMDVPVRYVLLPETVVDLGGHSPLH